MSQTAMPSRGSASRIVRSSPSSAAPWPARPASSRSCTARARAAPPRLRGRDLARERVEHGRGVAGDPERVGVAAAEVLGPHVDLDQPALEGERPAARRRLAQLGADGEHDVGRAQQVEHGRLVGGRARAERMVGRDRALAHVGGDGRRVEPLGQRGEGARGAGAQHAAAGPEHRPLARREHARGLGDRGRIGRRDGSRQVERPRAPHVRLAVEHVARHLQHDRPLRRRERLPERLGHELRQLGRILRERMPLRARGEQLATARPARGCRRARCRAGRATPASRC